MNDAFTLGVIGHVDHGKTALVRALTGIETDRLKEERERGLSIVLGFAFIDTPHGVVDLIDVPGHENFVRAMVGGATALDGIILCVAANEGVMPQTREHFNIARLLGVTRGFAVLTKTDLVDPEELELARDDLDEFLADTVLAGAPVIEVSAQTGAGIEAVRHAIETLTQMPIERDWRGRFFLPLDRAFTIRGFGQVVTGTLRGGNLSVGDTVEIVPGRKRSTVRALQNHNRPIEAAKPGQRVAVNLRHVDRDEVRRGDVLVPPGSLAPTTRLDAELHLLGDAPGPVRNGTVVRLLTGTTEAMARLRLLDRRVIEPGETAMTQFNLDREIATQASEHYLIRNYSPVFTIGGGRILEIHPERHRRFDPAVTARLATVATGEVDLIVRQLLNQSGAHGIRLDELAEDLSLSRDEIRKSIDENEAVGITDDRWVVREAYDALLSQILLHIASFHERNPFKTGIDLGSLITEMTAASSPDVTRHAATRLVNDEKLRNDNEILRIAGYDPFASIGDRERRYAADVERAFLHSGIEWLSPQVVAGSDDAKRAALQLLIETGRLVRLRTVDRTSEMIVHAEVIATARQAIERHFPSPQSFALKDIRDLLGSTRKHIVPLMEHMDATGVTVRYGDMRRLRGS